MKALLYCLILLLIVNSGYTHKCVHNKLFGNKTLGIATEVEDKTYNLKSDANEEGLKIYYDYNSINHNKLVDDAYIENLKKGLEGVKEIFAKLLTPNFRGKITIQQELLTECNSNFIYTDIYSQGVDADIIIVPYVVSQEYLGEGTIASAGACGVLQEKNRPILGLVYLGSTYDFSTENSIYYLQHVLLHELTHVLVFSPTLFSLFKKQPSYELIKWDGVEKLFMVTPRVVATAKKHFGCDQLAGVELETQGGQGSVGSHWESRIMLGDYMVSSDIKEMAISDITLALFEDSGWYTVNHYTGGLFRYGRNQGCDFILKKCIINEKSNFDEFCTVSGEQMCYGSHLTKGKCYLKSEIENISVNYQYFSDPTKGGYGPADFCPVAIVEYPSEGSYPYMTHCKVGKVNEALKISGEKIGDHSACFMSSLMEQSQGERPDNAALCYEVDKCDNSTKTYVVKVNGKEANCTSSKEKVKIEGYTGELECAPFDRICTGTKYCNDIFSCVEEKSIALDMEMVIPPDPITPTGNSFNLKLTLYSLLVLLFVSF